MSYTSGCPKKSHTKLTVEQASGVVLKFQKIKSDHIKTVVKNFRLIL